METIKALIVTTEFRNGFLTLFCFKLNLVFKILSIRPALAESPSSQGYWKQKAC